MPRTSLILLYAGAGILFACSAYLTYHKDWKESKWLYPIGITLSVGISVCWWTIAKTLESKNQTYVASVMWDAMISTIFIAIPYFFFQLRPSWRMWLGAGLIVLGCFILKTSCEEEKTDANAQSKAIETGEVPPAPVDPKENQA